MDVRLLAGGAVLVLASIFGFTLKGDERIFFFFWMLAFGAAGILIGKTL